jgi:hypothetical protein
MTFPLWAWLTFAALVAVLLFLDLFVFHRGAKEVPFREAMWLSGFWIAISLVFGGFVWVVAGPSAGGEYLAAYLIEKSLSLDNVFVFAVIFSAFAVPRKYRYHVLFWGVIGALVARAVFILAGTRLLSAFDWHVPRPRRGRRPAEQPRAQPDAAYPADDQGLPGRPLLRAQEREALRHAASGRAGRRGDLGHPLRH